MHTLSILCMCVFLLSASVTPMPAWSNCMKSLSIAELGSDALNAFLGDAKIPVIFQNDITTNSSKKSCASMTILFARGTSEPGNVGILTGPPFFAAVGAFMNGTGDLAIQGVDYAADVAGFRAGGSAAGAVMMAGLVNKTLAACPNTLLTLSGYSQGAQIVHAAMPLLSPQTTAMISSVVLFGDPKNGTAIENIDERKVYTICHKSDLICKGGDRVSFSHLNYVVSAPLAADWVVNGMGMGMLGISSKLAKSFASGGLGS